VARKNPTLGTFSLGFPEAKKSRKRGSHHYADGDRKNLREWAPQKDKRDPTTREERLGRSKQWENINPGKVLEWIREDTSKVEDLWTLRAA